MTQITIDRTTAENIVKTIAKSATSFSIAAGKTWQHIKFETFGGQVEVLRQGKNIQHVVKIISTDHTFNVQ